MSLLARSIVVLSAFSSLSAVRANFAPTALQWTRLHDLPEPAGLKGMYGGVSNGRIILAGGSNFPVPAAKGGTKTFHDAIHCQPVSGAGELPWDRDAASLPEGMAEGACVQTPAGIVAVGGFTKSGPVGTVFFMQWDEARGRVALHDLPDLPSVRGYAAAAWLGGRLYVAGGQNRDGGMHEFLFLDRLESSGIWRTLPAWPGPRRFGAVLAVMDFDGRERLVLCGGKIGTPGPSTSADYLDDVFAFDPDNGVWQTLPSMPRPALLAPAVRVGASLLAVCGGSDGHDIERLAEIGDAYRIPEDVMLFDGERCVWSTVGRMPIGVVGAAVIRLDFSRRNSTSGPVVGSSRAKSTLVGRVPPESQPAIAPDESWIVAGGEYSPGKRTAKVNRLEFSPWAK